MDLPNNAWTLVATAPDAQLVQNTGDTNIIFVIVGALPGVNDNMADGEHFVLRPYAPPIVLPASALNLYARSFGPKVGKLTTLDTTP